MTDNIAKLVRISAAELDPLLERILDEQQSELVLLGPSFYLSPLPEKWPEELRNCQFIYQLTEFVDNLGEKLQILTLINSLILCGTNIGDAGAQSLSSLTQLSSLDLSGNQIGDAGTQSLSNLKQLSSLDLGYNQIGAAGAQSLSNLKQLSSLNLGGNQIGDAGAQSLSSLKQLSSLNLFGNQIGDAGAQSLSSLKQLSSLNLFSNQIGDTGAQSLSSLKQLSSLNLFGNRIGDAGAQSLSSLNQLSSLNLFGNHIGAAGAQSLSSLNQLRSLDLSDNQIGTSGAQAVSQLTQLSSLYLRGNQIGASGAQAVSQLTQLSLLDLSVNQIGASGVQAVSQLTQLSSLYLRGNQIGDSGVQALSRLTQLSSLDLSGNHIGDSGVQALSQLTQLSSLDLSGNHIGDSGVQALSQLTQLSSLDLSVNQIGDSGVQALSQLTQLSSLDLSGNQIGDPGAQALSGLTQLSRLYLEGNQIGDRGVQALVSITVLESLDLSKTAVSDLTPLAKLAKLRWLNVCDTKITDLSPLKSLFINGIKAQVESVIFLEKSGIYVDGCPLEHPPPEVVEQGNEAVLNYFREIEAQGEDRLFEAKVLIVGEGGSGKTSLLRRLYQPDLSLPEEDETTRGIEIGHYDFPIADNRSFRLNVWDFGGQQIYHATHQFFLTKRSLYILVDDTRSDHKSVHDEGFKYWLEVIEVLSDNSPVLIFQNEKGGRSKAIDEAGIKGRFANVREVYRGDLNQPDSASGIRQAIEFFVQQLPHIGEAVPAKWLAIRSDIKDRAGERPYISQQEYFDIYARHLDFDRVKALHLSRYLHDLGVFLHFQADRFLGRTVILQNQWATEAVFTVLDDETVKSRQGRFTRADCERLWAGSDYADVHMELLALMEKFELCYLLADTVEETWLAPQLLPPSTPAALLDWAEPGDLVVYYRYEFMPKGLVSRLMVRLHRFVRQPELAWISGVLFERDQTQVLLRATDRGNEILMRARGPECKALFSVVASELDALNAGFTGLEGRVQKLVPCHCSQCAASITPELFEQKRLEKRKQDHKLMVECPASYEDVSVLELLDGLKLEQLPVWARNPDAPDAVANKSDEPAKLQTVSIFLASSEELRADRDEFDLYFRQQNDLLRKRGLYLEIVRWENFLDVLSETRLQDEYNKQVCACDIFVSLFMTKTGQYTEEEFDVAHQSFQEKGRPLILTFFKNADIATGTANRNDLNSLWDFQDKLKALGHFWTNYDNTEHLKRQFKDQLEMLLDQGRL